MRIPGSERWSRRGLVPVLLLLVTFAGAGLLHAAGPSSPGGVAMAQDGDDDPPPPETPAPPTAAARARRGDGTPPWGRLPLLILDDEGRPVGAATFTAEIRTSSERRRYRGETRKDGTAILSLRPFEAHEGRLAMPRLERPAGATPVAFLEDEVALSIVEGDNPQAILEGVRCAPLDVQLLDANGHPTRGTCEVLMVAPPETRTWMGTLRDEPERPGAISCAAAVVGQRTILAYDAETLRVTRTALEVVLPRTRVEVRLPEGAPLAAVDLRFLDDLGEPTSPAGRLLLRLESGGQPDLTADTTSVLRTHGEREVPLGGTLPALRLERLAPGTWEVFVRASVTPGVARRVQKGELAEHEDHTEVMATTRFAAIAGASNTATVVLPRPGVLRGVVTRGGLPSPRARASLTLTDARGGGSLGTSIPVDADGRFEVHWIGRVDVSGILYRSKGEDGGSIEAESRRHSFLLHPGDQREIVLSLEGRVGLAVRVRHPDGTPATVRDVWVSGPETHWSTEVEGESAWLGLHPGRYLISLGADVREVDIAEGTEAEVEFVLAAPSPAAARAGGLAGMLVVRLEEPRGVPIPRSSEDGSGDDEPPYVFVYQGERRVKGEFLEEGRAEIPLPVGRYDVLLVTQGAFDHDDEQFMDETTHRPRAVPATVDVPPGGQAEIVFRPAGIAAIVVTVTGIPGASPEAEGGPEGEPADPGWVHVQAVLPGGGVRDVDTASLERDDDDDAPGGSPDGARVDGLAAGVRYRISLLHQTFAAAPVEVLLPAGETRVTLAARALGRGTVRFQGSGLREVQFHRTDARSAQGWVTGHRWDGTPERSDLRSVEVTAGRYELAAVLASPGIGDEVYVDLGPLEVPARGEVVVRLPALGTASVLVFLRDRSGKARAARLRAEGGGYPWPLEPNTPAHVRDLPAGRYTLEVDGQALRTLDLAEEQELSLGIIDVP